MGARLEKTQDGFTIPLTAEMVEALQLTEGSAVDVSPVAAPAEIAEKPQPQIRYASVEEVMEIHRRLEPEYREVYRELAK